MSPSDSDRIPPARKKRIFSIRACMASGAVILGGYALAQAGSTGSAGSDGIKLISLDKTPPYGSYTPTSGSWYGHGSRQLRDADARRILTEYYQPKGLRIGDLRDRQDFFEAYVYRGDDRVDRVIIHKATGRFRSIY